MTEKELREKFGEWGEHPDYPVSDWKREVDNDDTRRGYWDWVAVKLEQDNFVARLMRVSA